MRECGMLLPVASLPSRYGIGAFSREAYDFIDTLKAAGQQYWQILPLGPTGFGDSPYQSFSAFAGNPYFIDLGQLISEGLLSEEECGAVDFGGNERDIDYQKIYDGRFPLLRKAYERWKVRRWGAQGRGDGAGAESGGEGAGMEPRDDGAGAESGGEGAGMEPRDDGGGAESGGDAAGAERVHELAGQKLGEETREYCFYMAVKDYFDSCSWNLWEEGIRLRDRESVREYRERLTDETGFYEFLQMKFEDQWDALKGYAHQQGIRIIGDIPIYVALDSADSWSHPELFQFDADHMPSAVAGCPPDGFAATGQLWGNPLYNWEYHSETGFEWWMKRMEYCFRMYDVVRVDHFRGFDEYYSIPYRDKTAEFGHWEKGPGIRIFHRMMEYFGGDKLPIIAEDLGFLTPSVRQLLKDTGFPGMKVLEFAFDADENSDYLPHKYGTNCVAYTGTHDNDTAEGWYASLNSHDRAFAAEYMGGGYAPEGEFHWVLIRTAMACVADLAVIPVQDYLGLDAGARINEPSTLGKNWRWRMSPGALDAETVKRCRRLAGIYGRLGRGAAE